ncbi:MAG: carboxyl transferase [Oscillospiraceae bacterium]|nr:carboxyl transferase [Oscillospiraceae bacterium]
MRKESMENSASIAKERLSLLFDNGTFTELDALRTEKDSAAAVVCAHGFVEGQAVCAFAQSSDVKDGIMGKNTAGKIKRLLSLAAKTGTPIVGVYDSNGVFVDGTADSLSAYGKLIASAANLSGVVPQISVIAGVCAGSAALMACEADFVLATKKAELCLTPAYGTDSASPETAAKIGLVAEVCEDDAAAMMQVKALLRTLPANNLAGAPISEFDVPEQAVSKANLLDGIADMGSLMPLYSAYGETVETALATIRGTAVGLISTAKSDAALTADDAAKIARFVRTCDAFSIPVITLLDTIGFTDDTDAAKAGSLRAITQLCGAYAEATTVKISVITGLACGAAFSAIAGRGAGSDLVFAWNDAVIAPLKPEAAVEFLWHDKLKGAADVNAKRKSLADEYGKTLASATKAAELGVIDTVIAPADTRQALIDALDMLEGKRVSRMPKKHSNIPF